MKREVAAEYIQDNFPATDRLAVVLLNKRTGAVIQRLASAEKIAAPEFQAWLRYQNAQRWEVYLSMNALKGDAQGRTKAEVAAIRHIYFDFDENGTDAVRALLKREDLPPPNYLINSSPDKWQVIWKVEGFGMRQAEALQRGLARELGADPAATDISRVLRLPGFNNHKYAQPHLIRAEIRTRETYRPERFPSLAEERLRQEGPDRPRTPLASHPRSGRISQSERDWAFAMRKLSQGESPEKIIAAIAHYRRDDKYSPQRYAELTVRKASEALARQPIDRRFSPIGPDERHSSAPRAQSPASRMR